MLKEIKQRNKMNKKQKIQIISQLKQVNKSVQLKIIVDLHTLSQISFKLKYPEYFL